MHVYNMQEVWAVLEIAREECWLNEIVNGIAWNPEIVAGPAVGDGMQPKKNYGRFSPVSAHPSFACPLSDAVSGTYTPLSIRINVYVVAPVVVVLTFPERPAHARNGQYLQCIPVMLNGPAGAIVEV